MPRCKIRFLLLSAGLVTLLLSAPSHAWAEPSYTTNPPGVVVDHMPAKGGCYVGSPSIAILPKGRYVASHDIFGPQSKFACTRVFESTDRGVSWQQISEIDGAFWSTVFAHRGSLYLMGTDGRYGNTVIRR